MTKLTIGMIVKNEAEKLRRTLEALEPLREKVSTQLVIADTGSTDETLAIAREFTNEAFTIAWENDFAKARNDTVLRARGKWYFYLDADEVLENPKELIDFLLSKEEKDYQSIELAIHNVMSQKNNVYTDSWSARFFRPGLGVRFTEAIHERHDVYGPVYRLQQTRLLHSGYDNDTPGWMAEKAKRNIAIMESYVTGEMPLKRKIKALLDYADSLLILPEKRAVFGETIEQALALIEQVPSDDGERICQIARAYSLWVRASEADRQSEETFARGLAYLKKQPVRGVWDMDVYYALMTAAQTLKQYDKCIDYAERYLALQGKDICDVTKFFVLMSLSHQDYAYYRLSQAYLELGQYEEAWQAARQIKRAQLEALNIKHYWWQLAFQYEPAKHLPLVLEEAKDSPEDKAALLASLASAIGDPKTTDAVKEGVCQALLSMEQDAAVRQVLALYVQDGAQLGALLEELTILPAAYGSIIAQCLRLQVPMSQWLKHIELVNLEDYLAQCSRQCPILAQLAFKYYQTAALTQRPLIEHRTAQYILCYSLFYTPVEEALGEALLSLTIEAAYGYMQRIYQPELLISADREAALSPLELFVCTAAEGLKARKMGDEAAYVRALRQGLLYYPRAKDVLTAILERLTQKAYPPEFIQLARQVKENIRMLLERGQAEEARLLLDELAALMPEDEEISQFEERLWCMRY